MSNKAKATATKEEAIPALVPKLRFPEFREGEGWEYAPLGKLLMKSPDYGVNAAAVPFTERLPQYLRITDISEDGTYLSAQKVSVDLEPKDEIYLDDGDIVLARTGASVGKSYRYRKADGRLVFAGFLIRVKPNPKRLVSAYLANFLTTEQYWKWVAVTSTRSGQPGINSVEYSALAIPLPPDVPEQQKIAECLSSVDELMATQARKVEALKTHKKGLMQKLFPPKGETQPRLRFPEFQNAGEWGDQSIGDFGKVVTGSTPSTARPEFYGGGIPFVSPADISGMRFVDQTKATLTAEGFAETRPIRAGSILFVCIGSTIGKVAQSIYDCATNQQINAVVPNSKHSDNFVYFALSFASERIALLAGRQAVPIINKTVFSSVRLLVPKLDEQQRIASCLSSLDALITAEAQKLEALKCHKKGLMQQLFPSPERSQT
ncbi:restriction endonuclease subunit S [Pandoraea commovens]|uniref:Restriction endonuclease subunit S n=1 Tax=Pandoraea commovens TaxID=2508289 RepID=A0A5E4T3V4_9BURK|nr:restriction endonuclease subunit S [Pandoraea commovens]VVD82475.1 restriction endonuclease subunit S [Pandoraea commovens]